MGRPDLSDSRREDVFEAISRCVIKFGLAGTTLAKLAEESGMSRGHIRHYLGNREELILAYVRWFFDTRDNGEHLKDPQFEGLDDVLGLIFGPEFSESNDQNTIVIELWKGSRTDDRLREAMFAGYNTVKEHIAQMLGRELPAVQESAIANTSFALLCLAIGNAVMNDLGRNSVPDSVVQQAGLSLIASLRTPGGKRG